MKKILPVILGIVLIVSFFSLSFLAHSAYAAPAASGSAGPVQMTAPTAVPTGGLWVVDPEVTFIGKNAARAGLMLDWTLANYNWVCVKQLANGTCDNNNNPLAGFWSTIVLYIVIPMLFLVILATAIVIIITRGRSLTIMRFIPRFVAVILLIVFSYAILQFLYQFTDLIQGFFLVSQPNKGACPPNCISQSDLLYVGWRYQDFIGLRLLGDYNAESAFISLLLTKLTALTYFVMVGILLMRKIILWFFIIVSPIFPLLLLYYPVRNTGKIWIGEFFRWLLYAPLFAIFLKGLVYMWRNQIPLVFSSPNIGNASAIIFPTAVNILLGGPGQNVSPTNSVNLTQTFALYVVALIMLWVVILLPWILLQIFLDYASNFSPSDTAVMKTLVSLTSTNKVTPPGGTPSSPQPGGAAISLPFAKKFTIPVTPGPTGAAKELHVSAAQVETRFAQPAFIPSAQITAQTLSAANSSLPTMRDIARYDTAFTTNDVSTRQEVTRVRETLEKIANPASINSTVEREKYTEIHDRLSDESQQGNIMATSIMNAVNNAFSTMSRKSLQVNTTQLRNILQQIANPVSTQSSVDREKLTKLHEMLSRESKENNNKLASSLLSVNNTTTEKEIEKIRETLTQAAQQGNSLAQNVVSNINTTAQHSENTAQVKNILQQISNPQLATTPAAQEKMSKLHEALLKESKSGNELASSVLAVSSTSTVEEIDKLREKLMKAKENGQPLAGELLSTLPKELGTKTNLPAVNRVQTVNQQDYQAVKDMWRQNYRNLQVPQGMAGTRQDWIKDDISKIDRIVGLLSSPDQEKVNQGLDEVSNILPFLLVGGFSQTEIIAYLRAKQEAAKEVSQELSKEEEEKVSVSVKHEKTHAHNTMAASIEATAEDEEEEEETSPLVATSVSTQQPANEILALVNVKVPRMQDIARYEAMSLSHDTVKFGDIQKIRELLQQIAHPEVITDPSEKQRVENLRQRLVAESTKGNTTAAAFLAAAASLGKTELSDLPSAQMKAQLQQLANPEQIGRASCRERV